MWNGISRADLSEGRRGPRPLHIDQQRDVVRATEGNRHQHGPQPPTAQNSSSASGQQQHQQFGQQHYMRGQPFVNMQNVPPFHHPPPPYHHMSVRYPGILPPPLMDVQPQFGTYHDSSLYSPMIGPPIMNPPTWGLLNRHSSFPGVPEEGDAFCQACGSSLRPVRQAAAFSTSHNHNTQPNFMQNRHAQRNSRENNEHETANRGIVPISAPAFSSAEVSETANPAFLRSFKEGLRIFIKEILNEEKEKKKKEKKQKQAAAEAAAEVSVAGAQESVKKWWELMTFSEDEAVEDPETVTVEVNEAIHLAALNADVKEAMVSTGKLDIVETTEARMLQSMEDIPSTSTTTCVSTSTSDPSALNDEEKERKIVIKIKKGQAFGEQ